MVLLTKVGGGTISINPSLIIMAGIYNGSQVQVAYIPEPGATTRYVDVTDTLGEIAAQDDSLVLTLDKTQVNGQEAEKAFVINVNRVLEADIVELGPIRYAYNNNGAERFMRTHAGTAASWASVLAGTFNPSPSPSTP